jgi:hypothetical protein
MPYYRRNLWLTALLVLWMMGLVTWVTWVVFTDPPEIPATTAGVVATIYALPGVAVGLWKWRGDKIKGPDQ